MSLPTLPEPCIYEGDDSPMYDAPTGYTPSQMQSYGQACYEKALLDAMNATIPFGKTGAVIAAAIGVLK